MEKKEIEKKRTKYDKYDNPQLCIPVVSLDITKQYIYSLLLKLRIGYIKDIIMELNYDKSSYKVIIRFNNWFNNKRANNIKSIIKENKCINLVYDFPNFWKCSKYNPPNFSKV